MAYRQAGEHEMEEEKDADQLAKGRSAGGCCSRQVASINEDADVQANLGEYGLEFGGDGDIGKETGMPPMKGNGASGRQLRKRYCEKPGECGGWKRRRGSLQL